MLKVSHALLAPFDWLEGAVYSMTYVLWIGSALGAVIGLFHAAYLYRGHDAATGTGSVYRGLWAFLLWTILGSYVLVLWIVSVVAYSLYKIVPKPRAG